MSSICCYPYSTKTGVAWRCFHFKLNRSQLLKWSLSYLALFTVMSLHSSAFLSLTHSNAMQGWKNKLSHCFSVFTSAHVSTMKGVRAKFSSTNFFPVRSPWLISGTDVQKHVFSVTHIGSSQVAQKTSDQTFLETSATVRHQSLSRSHWGSVSHVHNCCWVQKSTLPNRSGIRLFRRRDKLQ